MGKIRIKPENRGKFTAWARAHGMSVQAAAAMILRNRERYSPALIKRANFARNASKWEEGGVHIGLSDANVIRKPFSLDAISAYKSGGIHIKKKNRGKFNALKKRTGKSTEELTHSKNPLTRKRAIFAQNAKKWKHGDGGFMEALDMAGSIASPISAAFNVGKGIVEMITAGGRRRREASKAERERVAGIDDAQMQAQAGIANNYPAVFKFGGTFKGKKFGGIPNAEVEGGGSGKVGEVIITPDGVQTNIKGPTHAQGGVDVQLPDESLIIAKRYAKEVIPYTSKINKAKQVLEGGGSTKLAKNSSKLNLNKYYAKVLDVYNKQEARKLAKGGKVKFQTGGQEDYMYRQGTTTVGDDYLNSSSASGSLPFEYANYGIADTNKFSNADGSGRQPFTWSKAGSIASDIGAMAPMFYNLGQGLFGKRDKLDANRYRNPYEAQINSLMANRRYDIQPELIANEASYNTALRNLRNLGGSRGQVMSNVTGAQNAKMFGDMSAYAQRKNMENQYAAEYASALYPMGRDTAMTRMAVDEGNLMTDATGRNMIGASMTGLQQFLLNKRQMKNQLEQSKLLAKIIGNYSPYAPKWAPGMDEFLNSQE